MEKQNVKMECELTSKQQERYLNQIISENPGKQIRVFRIMGDARTAWRKYRKNENMHQIGHSSGSRGNSNYHSTWAEVK